MKWQNTAATLRTMLEKNIGCFYELLLLMTLYFPIHLSFSLLFLSIALWFVYVWESFLFYFPVMINICYFTQTSKPFLLPFVEFSSISNQCLILFDRHWEFLFEFRNNRHWKQLQHQNHCKLAQSFEFILICFRKRQYY